MEQPPQSERELSALEVAFNDLRHSVTKEQMLDFHQVLVDKNNELENEFGRNLLEAVPEWHAMVGSSYDYNRIDPDYADNVEAKDAVRERLAEILEELTERLG